MAAVLPSRIVSWNVNGLRAVYRKGAWEPFLAAFPDADVIALQEVRALPDQLPETLRTPRDWHVAFTPAVRRGYSGVALFTRIAPDEVAHSLGFEDVEGRVVGVRFGKRWVWSIYFPNGGGGPDRFAYKLWFYEQVREALRLLRREGYEVVVVGDFNVAHQPIDLARPKENEGEIGFHPAERAWLSSLLAEGFVDTFRALHPSRTGAYTWWDLVTRARDRNVGWRIDYGVVCPLLAPRVQAAEVHPEVFGSDHCPISLVLAE